MSRVKTDAAAAPAITPQSVSFRPSPSTSRMHIAGSRAERHPDTDFMPALAYPEGDHAINSHGGEKQGDRRKTSRRIIVILRAAKEPAITLSRV